MALALRILQGTVLVDGYSFRAPGKSGITALDGLPPGAELVADYLQLPNDAFTDTVLNAAFTVHPVIDERTLGPAYAEVRGSGRWRVCLNPSSGSGPNQNLPIGYFVWICDPFFACFELQVNEGCVRIAGLQRPYTGCGPEDAVSA